MSETNNLKNAQENATHDRTQYKKTVFAESERFYMVQIRHHLIFVSENHTFIFYIGGSANVLSTFWMFMF